MGTPRQVLVVDDEPDIRDGIAEVLRDEGFDVATASDGCEALAFLRAHEAPLAALLVDVQLPRLGGVELVREARRCGILRDAPVITVTASTRRIDGEAAHLRKPFGIDDLLRTLSACARP